MGKTLKRLSELDASQVLQAAYNDNDGTIAVGSFVAGKLGHKVERSIVNPTTDDFEFYDNAILLYTIRVVYTNSAHDDIVSAERIN